MIVYIVKAGMLYDVPEVEEIFDTFDAANDFIWDKEHIKVLNTGYGYRWDGQNENRWASINKYEVLTKMTALDWKKIYYPYRINNDD